MSPQCRRTPLSMTSLRHYSVWWRWMCARGKRRGIEWLEIVASTQVTADWCQWQLRNQLGTILAVILVIAVVEIGIIFTGRACRARMKSSKKRRSTTIRGRGRKQRYLLRWWWRQIERKRRGWKDAFRISCRQLGYYSVVVIERLLVFVRDALSRDSFSVSRMVRERAGVGECEYIVRTWTG